jgi:PAS domain S-box-containing protein
MLIEYFQKLVASWHEAMFLVSEKGNILSVNHQGSKLLGQTIPTLTGQRIADLVVDSPDKVSRYLRVCSRNKDPIPGALAWRKDDGEIIQSHCNGYVVVPGTKESSAVILLRCEDKTSLRNKFRSLNKSLEDLRISHRKLLHQTERLQAEIHKREQAEEHLKRSLDQFQSVMDSLDALVYVADMDTYEVLFVNKYAEQFWGDIVGKTCWKTLQAPQTGPCGFCTNEKLLDSKGKPTGIYHWEFQNTVNNEWYDCRDQAIRWIDGRFVRMEIATNITRRKKMEENLRKTSEILENVFSTSTFLIAYMDTDFNFIRVNKRYAEADDRNPEYFIGKNHFDLYPDEENKVIFRHVIETGESYSVCTRPFIYRKHPEWGVSYWDWSLFPVKNLNGKVEALELFLVNVTERKKAEEQITRSLKEKEILLREIYHRTKNNMGVICSLLTLESANTKDRKVQQKYNDIQHRIRSMALVHEKLYQSGDLSCINLDDYIKDLINALLKSYKTISDRISLKFDTDKVCLSFDAAIPCGLIINEILTNSLKHAFPNNTRGEIHIALHMISDNLIELVICDNGIGLPKGLDYRKADTLGLQLIVGLAEKQLGGRLEKIKTKGTGFKLRFNRKEQTRI